MIIYIIVHCEYMFDVKSNKFCCKTHKIEVRLKKIHTTGERKPNGKKAIN